MNRKHYQIISLLLSFFLCFSNLTMPIVAEGEESTEQTPDEETQEVVVEEQSEEPEEQEEQEEEVTEEAEDPESELAEEISEESSESEDVPVDEDVSDEVITPAEEEESDSEMLEDGEDPEETEISEVTEPEETEEPSELFGDVNVIADGDVSDTITWMLTDDMTLYLSGSGACPDYDPLNNQHNEEATYVPWKEYEQQIVKVVVENGITSVGEYTFYKNNALAEVILPNSVVSIGGYAFCIDKALTDITFPSQLETIGKFAFKRCAFTEINLPDSVTLIDEYAFDGVKLDSVIMPKNLMAIGEGAFGECGLTSVVLNDKLRTIGDKAFVLNKLSNIVIPQRVEEIGINPFTNNPLETIIVVSGNYYYYTKDNVLFNYEKKLITYPANKTDSEWTIPNGIETIGNSAFFLASNLETIHLPASLKTIESMAFDQAGLTSITIPSKVSEIGNSVFYSCTNLTEVKFNGNSLAKISQSTFDSCTSLREIYLPDSVSEIGINAFYNCKSLERIQFSRKMKTIGMSAFSSCRSLYTVFFRGRESDWNKIKISSGNTPLTSTETERIYVVPVEGIKVEKEEIHFDEVGMQRQLSYTVEPSDAYNTNVSFVDYDSSVINISDTGLITAVGEGITVGTVVTEDGGFHDMFLVTVGEYYSNLFFEVEVTPVWPKQGMKNVYADFSNPEITWFYLVLNVPTQHKIDSYNISNENLVITTEHGTVNIMEDEYGEGFMDFYNSDTGNLCVVINDYDNVLMPGDTVTVTVKDGLINYSNVDFGNIKYTTKTFSWSFELTSVNPLTDCNCFGNSAESTGITHRKFINNAKEKKDRLLNMAQEPALKSLIKQGMKEDNHGVCYGTTMTQALFLTNRISLSDLTNNQHATTYHDLNTNTDMFFRDAIIYYYFLQDTVVFQTERVSFAKLSSSDQSCKNFFTQLINRLADGELIPLEFHMGSIGTHIVLLYGVYTEDNNIYNLYYLDSNNSTPGPIMVDFRNEKFEFRTTAGEGYDVEKVFETIYAIDLAEYYSRLRNYQQYLDVSLTPGKRVLYRDTTTTIHSGGGKEFRNNSSCSGYSDMTLLNTIADSGDSPLRVTDYYLIKNLSDTFTVSDNNGHIQLSVCENDKYFNMDILNADSVDVDMENEPKIVIHGDNYSFDVEIMTDEPIDEYENIHLEIKGDAVSDVIIEKNSNEIIIISDKTIKNIVTYVWDGDDPHVELIGDSDRVKLSHEESLEQMLILDNSNLDFMIGDGFKVPVLSLPGGYTESDIIWSTDNSDLVEVSEDGTIHAIATGTAYVTATIEELSISKTVKVNVHPSEIHIKNIAAQKYTGAVIKPELSVYDGANKLTAGTDYTVTYKNNKNAYTLKEGDAGFSAKKAPQATIKASKNYSGTKTVYFTIDPADLTTDEVETLTAAYTGKVQKLSPAVKYKGKTLKKGTDYTVTYPGEGYKEPGIYEITVTGKGNYTGTRTYQMIIGAKDQVNLSKATVTTEKKSYAYDEGNQITPNVTVKSGKKVVDPSLYTVTYGENNTTGKGTITITGNDQETIGTKTITFTITGKPINKLVKVSAPKSVARGTALTDSVTISTELTEGTDYTVQYPETVNAGKVKVVITGINGYIGTVSKTVTVTPDKITSENTEIFAADAEQMKNGAKPEVSVTVNGERLKEGTDYTTGYSNNKKAGTGTVTIKGKGNYSGTLKKTFTITPKDLCYTSIVYINDANSSTKKGSYKTTVVIRDEDGGELKAGTDYTLKFFDGETEIPASAKANDYLDKPLTVKIFGKGSYTGCIEGTYTVAANNTNLSKAVIKIRNQKYLSGAPVEITGQEQFSKAVMGKTPLTLGEDFAVYEYSNNVNKGTATVIFQGIGSYSGYKKVTYKIGQRSIKEYWGGVVSFLSRLMN